MTRSLTIGTAGHIDHGKTALVRALTGVDTDRLPEERRRGMSIELGYAPLVLDSGLQLSVVDVPGHERFVSTMISGASGIDLVLAVVACDDGVMPQTREHIAICTLLGIERAVVALTKRDLVGDEGSERARVQVEELLAGTRFEDSEIVECSIADEPSIERVRTAIAHAATGLYRCCAEGPTRLAVDRAFTLRGIGSVVTGTLWSGSIGVGDQLILAPDGPRARVRSVHVHDQMVDRAGAGRRVAASLVGVERGEARRGQMLIEPEALPTSFRLDVRLEALSDGPVLEQGATVRVLHGTADIAARVKLLLSSSLRPGGRTLAQLRLSERAVAARGDRLIVRLATPATTVAGGIVLDPAPRRHGGEGIVLKHLTELEEGSIESRVAFALANARGPVDLNQVASPGVLGRDAARKALSLLERAGTVIPLGEDVWIDNDVYDELRARILATVGQRALAAPLQPTLPIAALLPSTVGRDVLVERLAAEGCLVREGAEVRGPQTRARAADVHEEAAAAVLAALDTGASTPPDFASLQAKVGLTSENFQALIAALEFDGEVICLGAGVVYRRSHYAEARDWVVRHCENTGSVTVAALRDELATSRKYALAILDRLDADGVTRRVGDERVLRRQRRRNTTLD